jgi:hypothetical protein
LKPSRSASGPRISRPRSPIWRRRRASCWGRSEKEPSKLVDVRRLVAVYLPRTREIATSFVEVEGKGLQERARAERVRAVLKRIDETFQHFGERMVEGDAKELDIELNLLEDSIKQELESRS